MANEIATFFTAQGEASAPAAVAEHLRQFWDPRMRRAIVAFVASGGGGLSPVAAKAVEQLSADRRRA